MALVGAAGRIQRRLGHSLTPHGISFTDYLVLRQLHDAPDNRLRRIDLAEGVGLSASGVTRLLNPMEKIGLIAKEEAPRDARVSLVALTSAGARIFSEADVSLRAAAETILNPLDRNARNALASAAEALS